MPSLEKIRYLLITGIAIPEKVAQTCRTDLKEQPIRPDSPTTERISPG